MEKHFSREQSTKLIKLIRGVREIQNQVDPKDMKEIIEEIIQEDLIDKGIFNKEDFSWALEHVNKQIQFLNDNKKQYE